ncbi:hypothetical protein [Mycoplasma bradburyae]|uniref:hypothetical protein n=1 Tax=Mycoplasma bradburyae TaxID=2963128 RepID=UPI002341723B|nr:hypothetical protein [Mycoplasma bradburyae]MDC4182713.1 hypothetical protein [Mycoplasma bradburyae]
MNDKKKIITSTDIEKLGLKYNDAGEYNPEEIDKLLDIVVETLQFYEKEHKRYQSLDKQCAELNSQVKTLKDVIGEKEVIIKEMNENGYDRVTFMNKTNLMDNNIKNLSLAISQIKQIDNTITQMNKDIRLIKQILSK